MVTEYKIAHYQCSFCRKEVIANNASCPREGNNIIAQATLLKYKDRLPHRKIQSALSRTHGLKISPATIFDLTRRAAEAVQSDYDAILNKIRDSPMLYVDETGINAQGENHWIWTFTTPSETFFVIRKSRGTKVLIKVLTQRFRGIIVFDGWKPYARFTNRIQRCWAHLLRESKDIAEKFQEDIPLHNALKERYEILTKLWKMIPHQKSERYYGNWRKKRFDTGSRKSMLSRKSRNSSAKLTTALSTGLHLS